MADTLAAQLATLMRERDRLEQFLMLDANWRALRQLDAREAAGEPLQAVDGTELRAKLEAVLAANRLYAARAKIIEAIELLNGTRPPVVLQAAEPSSTDGAAEAPAKSGNDDGAPPVAARETTLPGIRPRPISSRIVLLKETLQVAPGQAPTLEPKAAARTEPSQADIAEAIGSLVAAAAPDDLALVSGLDEVAVERLRAGGVTSFAAIAGWSAAETRAWRGRLADCARGPAGSWIEQAAMLAAGRDTDYAARVKRGGPAPQVPPADIALSAPVVPRYEILVPPAAFVPAVVPVVEAPAVVAAAAEVRAQAERVPVTTVEDAPVVAALPPLDVSDPVVVESQAAQPKRIIVIDAEEPFGDLGSDEPDAPAPKVTRSDSPSEAPAQRWKRAFDRRARVHTMSAARAAQVVDCGPEVVGETDDAAQIAPPIQQLDRDQAPAPRPGPIDEPAEVTIDDAIDDIGATTDASLMRRLQRAKVPDSFNRHDYAAYYDAVEEASVSIVRPVGPSTSAAASSAGSRPSAGGQPPVASEPRHNRVNRLLRALTGRGD